MNVPAYVERFLKPVTVPVVELVHLGYAFYRDRRVLADMPGPDMIRMGTHVIRFFDSFYEVRHFRLSL